MDNNVVVDEYTKKVASIIRRHQEASGISYRSLVDLTGLSLSTVERLLNGKRQITIAYLYALAPHLGFEPHEVLAEADSI